VSDTADFSCCRCVGTYCDGFTNIDDPPPESTEALLAVADGTIDVAFILMCGHKVWDIAFSSLLVGESGGTVSDENGRQLTFRSLNPQHEWIVASNGKLHSQSLQYFRRKMGLPETDLMV
jgi:3'-phosphoadenosine 5'-phosphosulfate (PAPS) 3'-phosphatase